MEFASIDILSFSNSLIYIHMYHWSFYGNDVILHFLVGIRFAYLSMLRSMTICVSSHTLQIAHIQMLAPLIRTYARVYTNILVNYTPGVINRLQFIFIIDNTKLRQCLKTRNAPNICIESAWGYPHKQPTDDR